jgi:hypothetical protein
MSLTTTIGVNLKAQQGAAGDLSSASATVNKAFNDALASGTGADQADLVFSDRRTLAASANETLDFAGGAIVDAFGATIAAFAEIVGIMVVADAGNANDVVLGNGTNPIVGGLFGVAGANTINVAPGGCVVWWNPKNPAAPVTAATGDGLKVANGGAGTPVTYDIIVIGRSA